jgi:hypothetical protein
MGHLSAKDGHLVKCSDHLGKDCCDPYLQPRYCGTNALAPFFISYTTLVDAAGTGVFPIVVGLAGGSYDLVDPSAPCPDANSFFTFTGTDTVTSLTGLTEFPPEGNPPPYTGVYFYVGAACPCYDCDFTPTSLRVSIESVAICPADQCGEFTEGNCSGPVATVATLTAKLSGDPSGDYDLQPYTATITDPSNPSRMIPIPNLMGCDETCVYSLFVPSKISGTQYFDATGCEGVGALASCDMSGLLIQAAYVGCPGSLVDGDSGPIGRSIRVGVWACSSNGPSEWPGNDGHGGADGCYQGQSWQFDYCSVVLLFGSSNSGPGINPQPVPLSTNQICTDSITLANTIDSGQCGQVDYSYDTDTSTSANNGQWQAYGSGGNVTAVFMS